MIGKAFFSTLTAALAAATLWCGCSSHAGGPAPVTDPAQLAAPPSGQGFQFKTELTPIPAGTEEQDCYFYKISDLAAANGLDPTQPVYLHRVQVVQKPGSHHMNVFRVRTIVGLDPAKGVVQKANGPTQECFKSPNWADWPLVTNTQREGDQDWTYPDGVANEFMPDEWIMLQSHYVNATTQTTPDNVGQVAVNFWTMPKEKVTAQLGTVFATKQSIRVCAHNATPTFAGSCQLNSKNPVTIIGANGHFHSRGTQFDIFSWDGTSTSTPPDSQRFYQSLTWDEPPMLHSPDLDVQVPAGGGIWYSCSYDWSPPSVGCDALNQYDQTKYMTSSDKLDCCYTFGPVVEKNEHCNAFIYYYPKQDNVTCF